MSFTGCVLSALMVLNKVASGERTKQSRDVLETVSKIINTQQEKFGNILQNKIIPLLQKSKIRLLYNQPIPESLHDDVTGYFYNEVASFIRVADLERSRTSFLRITNFIFWLSLKQQMVFINNL